MSLPIKWCVEYFFVDTKIHSVCFVVDDFDSALSVIRVIRFQDEVFRITMWQRRDAS